MPIFNRFELISNLRVPSLCWLAWLTSLIFAMTGELVMGDSLSRERSSRQQSATTKAIRTARIHQPVRTAVVVDDGSGDGVSQAGCKDCQADSGVMSSDIPSMGHEEGVFVEGENVNPSCDCAACTPWGISITGGCDTSCGFEPCSPLGILSRRLYMRAEVASFWGSGQFLPILVTTSIGQPLPPVDEAGVIGDPDTRSLFGGSEVVSDGMAGIRYEVGLWLDDCRSRGFLVRMFDSGDNEVNLQTDGTRQAVIARNFLDVGPPLPQEQSVVSIAYPNQTQGSISANLSSGTSGGDVLLRNVLTQDHLGHWDWLMGYQTARLSESLDLISSTTNLNAPNSILDLEDHFQVRSQFHGATFGFAGEAREGNWFLSGLFKLGLGNMERQVNISGSSRTTVGSDTSTQDQGLLARQTNNGTYTQDTFVVVPELDLHIGYRLTRRLDLMVGYTLLRLPKVGRVTGALDSQLASNLSDPLVGNVRPIFTPQESNFTLQSLNLGLQWAY